MNLVEKITKSQIRSDIPEFRVGDTVRVDVKIIEGKRERIQAFEGIVMAIQGTGVAKNFVVRKISSGVGVERTFPVNSPKVAGVEVIRNVLINITAIIIPKYEIISFLVIFIFITYFIILYFINKKKALALISFFDFCLFL